MGYLNKSDCKVNGYSISTHTRKWTKKSFYVPAMLLLENLTKYLHFISILIPIAYHRPIIQYVRLKNIQKISLNLTTSLCLELQAVLGLWLWIFQYSRKKNCSLHHPILHSVLGYKNHLHWDLNLEQLYRVVAFAPATSSLKKQLCSLCHSSVLLSFWSREDTGNWTQVTLLGLWSLLL